jgi:hypothetical protein
MKFKEWLILNEEGDDSLILKGHPAYASGYGQASQNARDFQVWRKRIDVSRELGNPLINIDLKQRIKTTGTLIDVTNKHQGQ